MSTSVFILDCSITMAWCFEDEATPYTDSVLNSLTYNKALVPSLWKYEVSNVLLMAERKKRIREADMLHFLRLLNQLPIKIETDVILTSINDIVLLGRIHQLTSYDTCYLHLALSLGLPIATLDKKLKNAAQQAGASLYQP